MATKAELKELKQTLLAVLEQLECHMDDPDLATMKLFDEESFYESGTSAFAMFSPRVLWFVRRLSWMIDKLPREPRSRVKLQDIPLIDVRNLANVSKSSQKSTVSEPREPKPKTSRAKPKPTKQRPKTARRRTNKKSAKRKS